MSKRMIRNWEELPLTLSLGQCAVVLGVCYDTLNKYVLSGEFPIAKKICGKYCVEKQALIDYLRSQD